MVRKRFCYLFLLIVFLLIIISSIIIHFRKQAYDIKIVETYWIIGNSSSDFTFKAIVKFSFNSDTSTLKFLIADYSENKTVHTFNETVNIRFNKGDTLTANFVFNETIDTHGLFMFFFYFEERVGIVYGSEIG